ncbi:MAG: glycosyltransferase family 2 protein [Spirochaetota bacterium]
MLSLSVVIPTFRGTPGGVIEGLLCALRDRSLEIIVVDDGSGAPWGGRLERLAEGYEDLRVITLPERRGQAYATLVGVASAKAEVIVTIDDDGDHPPEAVPELLSALEGGYDLVYGAPARGRTKGLRRLGTVLNNCLFTVCLGKPLRVPVTSFRAFRRQLRDAALRRPVRFGYLSAMLFSANPRTEVRYYRQPEGKVRVRRGSRYGVRRLVALYGNLLLHWGPLRPLSAFSGLPKRRFGYR